MTKDQIHSKINEIKKTFEKSMDEICAMIQKPVTEQSILKTICFHFNCTKKDLAGKSKSNDLPIARQMWGMLLDTYITKNRRVIAHKMGRKSHNSASKNIDDGYILLKNNKGFENRYKSIEHALKNF